MCLLRMKSRGPGARTSHRANSNDSGQELRLGILCGGGRFEPPWALRILDTNWAKSQGTPTDRQSRRRP
jgi:hypothetical protein